MRREHITSADSKWKFTTANYLLTTTPEIEYVFVTAPESGLFFLGLEAWPAETVDMPSGADKRTPMSTAVLELHTAEVNERLAKIGGRQLLEEEVISARLYTGPLYMKYNVRSRISTTTLPGGMS